LLLFIFENLVGVRFATILAGE